ncbi:MAG TPA: 30S ribosome-binding factor RbfA [Amoebophilaceae bacterium]|jgi:ribosome-binding factor A|nr:30S ribosome-binding factor RbfA [Amoebophilaceae bacterium]
MAPAIRSVRKEQMCRLLYKELGTLFLTEAIALLDNTLVSVAAVYMGKDFGVAKVYLSFSLHEEKKEALMQRITYHKQTIRRLLGKRLAHRVRKIPDLLFYADDTVMQGARVTALIDQLSQEV